MKIRTRYAPSPTGRMHVGNLRTALYAYLIAKHDQGDFLLRIEDTDQNRFVEGALEIIYTTLEKTGLIHDEGPDKEGPFGPYVQSDRQKTGMYLDYAKQLVEKGEAYYCFCKVERLENLRTEAEANKQVFKYDKQCLHLSKEEAQARVDAREEYVIRQNNPTSGSTTFNDEIYGTIEVDNQELDDMVLIKSDGFPTYNFANVVDDHTMGITHVVRGNEYLSSSPKYNRLYEAFGWEVPVYVHCPLITNEEGQKLSKRSGHASYEDLVEQGFIDEAIVNFVALLGWSPGSDQEIFTLQQLTEIFDYKRINKSPAVFDMMKFRWMNSEYIKRMSEEAFYDLAAPYLKQKITSETLDLKKIAQLIRPRVEVLTQIPGMIGFLQELPEYTSELYLHKKMKSDLLTSKASLEAVLPVFESITLWTQESIHDTIMALIEQMGIKNGLMLWPIRTALSGQPASPGGAFELADILGKEETLKRLTKGLELLA